MQGAWFSSLVRELDPTLKLHCKSALHQKIPHASTKTWHRQIGKYLKNNNNRHKNSWKNVIPQNHNYFLGIPRGNLQHHMELVFLKLWQTVPNYFLERLFHFILLLSSVQSLSCVWLFATPWIAACPASLSITNSRSLPKLMSIESVMPSSHLILYRPLLPLPPIPPSIRVFSNESTLRMRWPKYWSFSFSISPSNEHLGLISF